MCLIFCTSPHNKYFQPRYAVLMLLLLLFILLFYHNINLHTQLLRLDLSVINSKRVLNLLEPINLKVCDT